MKVIIALSVLAFSSLSWAGSATLTVDAGKPGATVSRFLQGQFAEHLGHCIYGGVWVGEDSAIPNTRGIRNDVVQALRELKVPVIRWPGGCFADEYHWMDGIGPREKRPSMVNTHWGGVTENNHFGTHEFLDLCEQVGAEPYISANVGSGTVQEMMQWVEYLTSDADAPMPNLRRKNGRNKPWKVKWFGVGNENWGCGGSMRPEYYADQFLRYNTYAKNYGENTLFRIACGPNGDDYRWTDVLMGAAKKKMDGIALHYYTSTRSADNKKKLPATGFSEDDYYRSLARGLRMEELIAKHLAVMEQHDPEKKVSLLVDEWGVWTAVEPGTNPGFLYQQNTLRDAIVAATTLDIFHKYPERIQMANIAQMVNVLQAMILTDGPKMVLTPTYHAFELYKVHQDAKSLPVTLQCESRSVGEGKIALVSASASRAADGAINLSLSNLDATADCQIDCLIEGAQPTTMSGRTLTASAFDSHNTFESPETVKPVPFTSAEIVKDHLKLTLPAKSILTLTLR